jgi:hypothetical protein
MTSVSMTPQEFADIKSELLRSDPDRGIRITEEVNGKPGGISGKNPINWSAEYTYADGKLSVKGHGVFIAGKVEEKLVGKLNDALARLRQT